MKDQVAKRAFIYLPIDLISKTNVGFEKQCIYGGGGGEKGGEERGEERGGSGREKERTAPVRPDFFF